LSDRPVPHRFRALDAWRGICALLIAAYHTQVPGHIYWQPLIRHAWPFVDFFFVLSGFVIAFAYDERLNDTVRILDFIVRRFARLWPLHVAILALMIGLEFVRLYGVHIVPAAHGETPFTGEHAPWAILTNILLIQALGFHGSETWNGPAWSISVEFATYIVFALTCLTIRRANARRGVAIALCVGGAIGLAVLSPLGMRDTVHWPVLRCFYGFFLGVMTFDAWRMGPRIGTTLTETLALVAVCLFVSYCPGDPVLSYLATPLFAVAVYVFAQEGGAISRLLCGRIPQALGRWSYSIYMVHMFVLAVLFAGVHALDTLLGKTWLSHDRGTAVDLGNTLANDALTLALLAAIIGVAAATYRLIERPGQRYLTARIPHLPR
jgi:peptidoglycan/LPS O-acetylase OafA/YrhL